MTEVMIVTGFSGAGKTVVLRTLEDAGFFCIDNIPSILFSSFFHLMHQHNARQKVAFGIDVRSGHDLQLLAHEIHARKKEENSPWRIKVIFVSALTPELIKRFQETRRAHPLVKAGSLSEAIDYEGRLLEPLRAIADIIIQTDQMTIHQLRSYVRSIITAGGQSCMIVHLMSFGFKYGIPHESSFVYDIRSLPNPYFVEHLKQFDGRDERIQTYLFEQPLVQEYWKRLADFFYFTLETLRKEGRLSAHVSIGCTGGKHRSVAFVEQFMKRGLEGIEFCVKHRDLSRDILG